MYLYMHMYMYMNVNKYVFWPGQQWMVFKKLRIRFD